MQILKKNIVGERYKHGYKALFLQKDVAWIQGLFN